MIVVLYDATTGEARSIGSVVPDPVPEGLSVYTLDVPYATQGAYAWDAVLRALVPRPTATIG